MTKKKRLIWAGTGSAILLVSIALLAARTWSDIYRGITFSHTYTDRNGELLQTFLTPDDKFRMYRPLAYYPKPFIEAVLLQEDRFFYSHHGVNPAAVVKAFWQTYVVKSRRIGASTITMQTAKLKYGLYTRSVPGKIVQIFRAWQLELLYSKDEILECYLNLVPCGSNIEGFETASWYYFNRSVDRLSLSEMLTLIVLPQNPTKRAPTAKGNPPELLAARKILYESWVECYPEAEKDRIYFDMPVYTVCSFPDTARHYTQMLNDDSSGTVRTTIDYAIQRKCERLLDSYIDRNRILGVRNGAMLLIDSERMEVVASVGSADFYDDSIQGQVNGTTAKRSPGSTLKPFIYAKALEQGIIHYSTMLRDAPQSFSEYVPDNYESVFKGPLPAWFALVDSRNIPAVDLAQKIHKNGSGLYEFLRDCDIAGLQERDHYGLSLVLGSAEVTMMELGQMYCAIANKGMYQQLNFIQGNRPYTKPKRVLTPESSYIVRAMLEQNIPPYELNDTMASVPVAWKTGTSIGFKDSWSVGIFDRYVLVVWIGNFNGEGNNSFLGRKTAAPLFFDLASAIMADIPAGERKLPPYPPESITRIPVCAVSGGLPNEWCPQTENVWFIPGVSPITRCTIHRQVYVDNRTGYRTTETDAPHVRSVVREFWPSDLQQLFREAGLPRLEPPAFPPDEYNYNSAASGFPPRINSPLHLTQYVFRLNTPERNCIYLSAGADADTTELLWFAGSEFIGRCRPGEHLEWRPDAGDYEVTVTDSRGRSSSVRITVVYA